MASFSAIAGILSLLFAADGPAAPFDDCDSRPSIVASAPEPLGEALHDPVAARPGPDTRPAEGGIANPPLAHRSVPAAIFAAVACRPPLHARPPLRLLFCTWLV